MIEWLVIIIYFKLFSITNIHTCVLLAMNKKVIFRSQDITEKNLFKFV